MNLGLGNDHILFVSLVMKKSQQGKLVTTKVERHQQKEVGKEEPENKVVMMFICLVLIKKIKLIESKI